MVERNNIITIFAIRKWQTIINTSLLEFFLTLKEYRNGRTTR